jgi:hypothetical protein
MQYLKLLQKYGYFNKETGKQNTRQFDLIQLQHGYHEYPCSCTIFKGLAKAKSKVVPVLN